MTETKKLVKINSETGTKVILTTLTEDAWAILEKEGIMGFEALQQPIILSDKRFLELEELISSPTPG